MTEWNGCLLLLDSSSALDLRTELVLNGYPCVSKELVCLELIRMTTVLEKVRA